MNYEPGDIFLVDSNAWYAKMVKFLMRSPTVWHYLVGRIYEAKTKKDAPQWLLKDSHYYHAGMILNDHQIIEQQEKVEINDLSKLTSKKHMLIRRKGIAIADQQKLVSFMQADLGKGYDVLLIFGKMMTWLTGIPLFALFLNLPHKEICINRISKEYYKMFRERWGRLPIWGSLVWSLTTTNDVEYYVKAHSNIYEYEEKNA